MLGVDGRALGLFHLLEYCLVVLVILASTVVTLRLLRKGPKSKRRDIGRPLTGRQISGAIAIMAIWWVSLISVDIYIDSTMEAWTFEEWAYENLRPRQGLARQIVYWLGSGRQVRVMVP